MKKQPLGYVLYEGPSMLDGQPIVAIATMRTDNAKTGNMVQCWILRADMAPTVASKGQFDISVCGHCPQRRSLGGACYVTLHQGPHSVYKSWKRGNYATDWSVDTFRNLMVRLGAYGDPAAVPFDVWERVMLYAAGGTGYTHQLRHPSFDPRLLDYVMVSADTPRQAMQLQARGIRTFRVKTAGGTKLPGEVECLNSTKGITCAACGLCNGARKLAPSVVIDVHGPLASRYTERFANANIIRSIEVA